MKPGSVTVEVIRVTSPPPTLIASEPRNDSGVYGPTGNLWVEVPGTRPTGTRPEESRPTGPLLVLIEDTLSLVSSTASTAATLALSASRPST